MVQNRTALSKTLLRDDGIFFSHIDDKDIDNRISHRLMGLLQESFGPKNYLDNLIWTKNTTHNDAQTFSHNHEYILAFAKNREAHGHSSGMFRVTKPGFEEALELATNMNKSFIDPSDARKQLKELYRIKANEFRKSCESQGFEWSDDVEATDPWKGIRLYEYLEYRDAKGDYVEPDAAAASKATLEVYQADNPSWPNANTLTDDQKNPVHPEFRFYKPIHPITGKECPYPARGWLWRRSPNPDRPNTLSFESLDAQKLIRSLLVSCG